MSKNLKHRHFSLIELIAVVAIGMILLGVVTVTSGRTPIFLSLDEAARQIGNLLTTASRQSSATGCDMTVSYDAGERVFRVLPAGAADTPREAPQYSKSLQQQFMVYALPGSIEIEFPEQHTAKRTASAGIFYLFPDGTGAGPETILKLRGKSVHLSVSPLTGTVIIEKINSDGDLKNAGT